MTNEIEPLENNYRVAGLWDAWLAKIIRLHRKWVEMVCEMEPFWKIGKFFCDGCQYGILYCFLIKWADNEGDGGWKRVNVRFEEIDFHSSVCRRHI